MSQTMTCASMSHCLELASVNHNSQFHTAPEMTTKEGLTWV